MHSHNHGHDHHGHHHHHATPADASSKAFVIGIILNAGYVVLQAIAGFATHSMALLSDAGHNLSDVAGLLLSLIAFKLIKVKATADFTYGYKKTTILAALINAVVLLITIGVLGYSSIDRLLHPEPVAGITVAWVAGAGIIVNAVSALLFFRTKNSELNAKSAYLHLLSDALVSLAVVISGIVVSFTHWYWLDPVMSIVVLLVILSGTWSLLKESLKLSMDAVPVNVDAEKIQQVISTMKDVQDIHHVHIWALSTTENALTAHLVLSETLSYEDKMAKIKEIKHELYHQGVQHATIELEMNQGHCVDC